MNHERHHRDGHGHHQGQPVVIQREIRYEIVRPNPREISMDVGRGREKEMRESDCGIQRKDHREAGDAAADNRNHRLGKPTAEDAVDGRPEKRRNQHEQEPEFHTIWKQESASL